MAIYTNEHGAWFNPILPLLQRFYLDKVYLFEMQVPLDELRKISSRLLFFSLLILVAYFLFVYVLLAQDKLLFLDDSKRFGVIGAGILAKGLLALAPLLFMFLVTRMKVRVFTPSELSGCEIAREPRETVYFGLSFFFVLSSIMFVETFFVDGGIRTIAFGITSFLALLVGGVLFFCFHYTERVVGRGS